MSAIVLTLLENVYLSFLSLSLTCISPSQAISHSVAQVSILGKQNFMVGQKIAKTISITIVEQHKIQTEKCKKGKGIKNKKKAGVKKAE